MKFLVIFLFLASCGSDNKKVVIPSNKGSRSEIEILKNQIFALQGTVSQIDNFIASDFSDCNNNIPSFERKVCQIAKTATAEQSVIFKSQLAELSKILQTEMYGADCMPDYDPSTESLIMPASCPKAGSVLDDINVLDAQVSSNTVFIGVLQTQMTSIQSTITSLQNSITSLENRLDNFNGSGSSIEAVLAQIDSDLSDLSDRVDDLETVLADAALYKDITVCADITSSGPFYETVLLQGDNTKITGYIQNGNKRGLGVVVQEGSGSSYNYTTLNTRKCYYILYDFGIGNGVNICWNNTDRRASQSEIDDECDPNGDSDLSDKTANCTCGY